jgi:serine/threonine protein kinase
VYRGVRRDTGEDVVIKKCQVSELWNRGGRTAPLRFLVNEIDFQYGLSNHPQAATILSAGLSNVPDSGEVYVLMTPADGDLSSVDMAGDKRKLMELVWEIASVLEVSHSRGIVHRDIKPANILLYGDSFCLADFGVSEKQDKISATLGTKRYLPSPQFDPHQTTQTDIAMLGVTLYEKFYGVQPPVSAFEGFADITAIRDELVEDTFVNRLILACVVENPELRLTAREVMTMVSDEYSRELMESMKAQLVHGFL